MTRTTKPRGHVQDRPSKDRILAVLGSVPFSTTVEIARLIEISPRCTRQHLYALVDTGEVARLDEAMFPLAWCLPDRMEQAREALHKATHKHFIPREHVSNDFEARHMPGFDAPIVQIVRPAGQWRLDHSVAVRSVFELGAM